tara:strand:- start:1372 stop:1872 length:501 start_codon:yes stop_codon:yes gene_type:complete
MKKFLIVFFITGTFLYGQTDTVLVSQDTNKIIVESDVNTDQENIDSERFSVYKILMYLGIVSIMIFLYVRYKKKSEIYSVTEDQLKTDTKNSETNWNNFFTKVSQQPDANQLYNKLIRLSHPDRFPNNDKKIRIANEITSLLGENKLNLEKLQELELRINKELLNV